MSRSKYCWKKFSIVSPDFPDLRTMEYEARLEVLRLWSLEKTEQGIFDRCLQNDA